MQDFAVLGPGGVGGLVAALLARSAGRRGGGASGADRAAGPGGSVTVVARSATAEHIAAHGIAVASAAHGDFTAPVRAVPALDRRADLLVVATKGHGLAAALERIDPALLDGGLVVPLLNGVEHLALLAEHFPGAAVLPAAVHVGAFRTAPGTIEHTSPYHRIEISGGAAAERAAAVLRSADIDVAVRTDGTALLWDKFAFLLPTALVCAHALAPIGAVREQRAGDLAAVVDEVARAAAAHGAAVDTAAVHRTIAERPWGTRPSMLFDRETGRPMELDPLGGALLRAAAARGIDVPVTERLVADLRAAERAAD
ncbi:ketopantoate reductase family protein [Nocardiopsis coralliicola]